MTPDLDATLPAWEFDVAVSTHDWLRKRHPVEVLMSETGAKQKTTRDAALANCPDSARHTACPQDYLGWHGWAERMHKTHYQVRCPGCGLMVIWVAQDALVDQLSAAIKLDENAASDEARLCETGSRYEGQPRAWIAHVQRWQVDRVRAVAGVHRQIIDHCVSAIAGCGEDEDSAIADLREVLRLLAGAYRIEVDDA